MKVTLITRCLHFTDLRPAFIPSPWEAVSPSHALALTERKNEWENKLAFQRERTREIGKRNDQVILRRLVKTSENSGGVAYTYANKQSEPPNVQTASTREHKGTKLRVFSGESATQVVRTTYGFKERKNAIQHAGNSRYCFVRCKMPRAGQSVTR